MTQSTVLVTRDLPADLLEPLRARCDVRLWQSDEAMPRDELLAQVADAEGLLCLLTEQVDADLLDAAPDLKVVSTMSVGYDHVDVTACAERGVRVGNTPGVLTDTTADLALALLLAASRRLIEAAEAVKSGAWDTWKPFWMTGRDLSGSTVGVVGLGSIGTAVAKRLRGFDCTILYSGPNEKPENAASVDARYVELDELLAESDFVTLHCPLNEETRHLINADTLAQMQSTATLVNTGRGGLVDQEALYDALKAGTILAAGLDVTTPEPLPSDHNLLTLDNCIVLPHIGSASIATRRKMAAMAVDNLLAGVAGEPLPNEVSGA